MTEPRPSIATARFLVVGVGGVGAPALLSLVAAGVRRLALVDDDVVELSNLHRQILFDEKDVGRSKLEATRDALTARANDLAVELHHGRALPSSVSALIEGASVVIDATDNFATRFMLADACLLGGVPVVHAAAVRWTGTVMSVGNEGGPCYRCLFEDIPESGAPDCATAGIVGPVCGVVGAIAAEMALAAAIGDRRLTSRIATFDGLRDETRIVDVPSRADCALCGPRRTIRDLLESRYDRPSCAA